MHEEISLREIVEVIWNRKILVIILTVFAMLIAGTYSYTVLESQYEVTSSVSMVQNVDSQILNSYTATIKNDVTINRIIDKLKLDKEIYSINSVKNSITVGTLQGTNVISLTVRGTKPSTIRNIANMMAFELGARIEISDRSQKIVEYQNELKEVENSILIAKGEIEELTEQIKQTPEKLVTKKVLLDNQFFQTALENLTPVNNNKVDQFQYMNEEINPLFNSLNIKKAETSIELSKQQAQKNYLDTSVSENQAKISELEEQLYTEKLKTVNSERLLNGLNAVFVSPAFEPKQPVGPNRHLTIVIAAFLGFMLSILFVILKYFLAGIFRKDLPK